MPHTVCAFHIDYLLRRSISVCIKKWRFEPVILVAYKVQEGELPEARSLRPSLARFDLLK